MATLNAGNLADFYGSPSKPVKPTDMRGRVRSNVAVITLATQTTSDIIQIGRIPKGARFIGLRFTTDTSLGTATAAVGITGSTAKYKAAGTFTATDTPTLYGKASAMSATLTADEDLFITIGTANFPASGTLIVETQYIVD